MGETGQGGGERRGGGDRGGEGRRKGIKETKNDAIRIGKAVVVCCRDESKLLSVFQWSLILCTSDLSFRRRWASQPGHNLML